MNRILAALAIFGVAYVQAASINVEPTTLFGVTIVSAEIVPEVSTETQALIVRFRNEGANLGEKVYIATTARSGIGEVKWGASTGVEVQVPIGGEQASSHRLAGELERGDILTVELVDISDPYGSADASRLTLESFPPPGGAPCEMCDWCAVSAALACGQHGVGSFGCECGDTSSCAFSCAD